MFGKNIFNFLKMAVYVDPVIGPRRISTNDIISWYQSQKNLKNNSKRKRKY